jgi:hypothetical protein
MVVCGCNKLVRQVDMATIIRDSDLTRIPGSVKPDSKKRVVLPGFLVREDIVYHIYSNSVGQIVLDPQVTIPASEAWLFNNPDALASVQRGLADAAQGRVSKVDLDAL